VLVPIVVFDIAGPIIVQSVARNHGASLTVALALSGVPPAMWILVDMLWKRRVDAVGVFVLTSIILATVIGLATGIGCICWTAPSSPGSSAWCAWRHPGR
jgi:hypothetical protein